MSKIKWYFRILHKSCENKVKSICKIYSSIHNRSFCIPFSLSFLEYMYKSNISWFTVSKLFLWKWQNVAHCKLIHYIQEKPVETITFVKFIGNSRFMYSINYWHLRFDAFHSIVVGTFLFYFSCNLSLKVIVSF